MEEIDLRRKQADFEGTRQEFKKELIKLENKRNKFLKLFPEEKLNSLKLEQYALQKGKSESKNSFCYWLENELKDLGDIHGATARKFGIYFGVSKNEPNEYKWRITSRFGDSKEEAFNNIKLTIISLLKSAENDNIKEIRDNTLSNLFKGKILSTYFPDNFLNIFDSKHLERFLDNLNIDYSDDLDEISKRERLLKFKNDDSVMENWTNYEFSEFLYKTFGPPPKKVEASDILKPYIESKKDYPKIKEVKAEFIDLNVNPENVVSGKKGTRRIGKTIDFEKENKIHKLLGNRGEEIVFNKEKEYLESIGKKELVEKINWVSKTDDSYGYDILSFEEDGRKKYIEVKSTNQSPISNVCFLISSNQHSKAKKLDNYYFYIVFNAKSKKPKVWKIKDPLKYKNNGLTLTPISFRVIINVFQ